jgi:hypothetical protein
MSETNLDTEDKTGPGRLIRWGIFAAVVLIAFLAGLIPMALQKWSVQGDLADTQKRLRQSEVKGFLTTAAVEAKRGEYEAARQSASGFFTLLDREQETAEADSFLKKDDAAKLKPIFAERDTVITMLAQRDPAAVERLTNIYSNYLQVAGVARAPAAAPSPAVSPPANSGP